MYRLIAACTLLILMSGCEQSAPSQKAPMSGAEVVAAPGAKTKHLISYSEAREPCAHADPLGMPLFGDVHVLSLIHI